MARLSRRFITPVATVALVVAVLVLAGVGKPPVTRSLMIHSDDAGMCEAVNRATIDALEKGCITSTSIMTCCPGYEEFAQYAIAHPERDFGVHLTLTSETNHFRWGPVLDKEKVPSLVQPDGSFWQSEKDVGKHARVEEAELELRAQIERAKASGIKISHLDHHMWVLYMRPDLLDLYVRLGEEYQLPIRFGNSIPPADMMPPTPEHVAAYEQCRERVRARGMPIVDFIDTANYDAQPDEKRAYFLKQIRRLPTGTSEFVVHCSYDIPELQRPHAPDRRAADTKVFLSPEIAAECRRLGIELVNYRTLPGTSTAATSKE